MAFWASTRRGVGFQISSCVGLTTATLKYPTRRETLPAYCEHNSVRVESAYGVKIHYVVRGKDVSE